jgi:hypothetical protein
MASSSREIQPAAGRWGALRPDLPAERHHPPLTAVRSPTTTGKVERLHLSLRQELLDGHEPPT